MLFLGATQASASSELEQPQRTTQRPASLPGRDIYMEEHLGWYEGAHVPHWDGAGNFQAVTYRLADSLPAWRIAEIEESLRGLPETDAVRERRVRIDQHLDSSHGCCVLRNPECAEIIVQNWRHYDGIRYDLIAYTVMPNHAHVLFRVKEGFPLHGTLWRWKSYSARRIRSIRPGVLSKGSFWHRDYWDRKIRDEQHFFRVVVYILDNPVKAGLCGDRGEWPWSWAHPEVLRGASWNDL
jgi:REP element-mobilizing transposase RayT